MIEYDEREIAARKTLKIWEHRVPPVWDGAWFTPKTSPLPICVIPRQIWLFCPTSASKGVRISIWLLPKLGSAGAPTPCGGAWLTPKVTPFPMCYPAEFGRSRSNGMSVIK